ncbi:hypothetical protein DL766_009627 [Monosporascus sp. MC13-8B]|uniref:Thioester reductase (TE) domain-containing protein n=1 Tax=Monosporascus cannonballus TaxID=155416 RepID=A0ABY0H5A4_9PEZI|nr:hypothetical protein DL763_010588 [Monosporascus cannonballus]RYO82666.1 hypothetical protein DL762_006483 [Monosporascus cannonballus]RYP14583.1 hypothetical protein DL766_009627 [Monosporascus sp. MC13-8B]
MFKADKTSCMVGLSVLASWNPNYAPQSVEAVDVKVTIISWPRQLRRGQYVHVRLSLFEEGTGAIFKEIDVIIHNGTDTSHLKHYPTIKGANVGSTRWLTRMCLSRRTPMHYVSSVGVALFSPGWPSFPPMSATDASPPPDGSPTRGSSSASTNSTAPRPGSTALHHHPQGWQRAQRRRPDGLGQRTGRLLAPSAISSGTSSINATNLVAQVVAWPISTRVGDVVVPFDDMKSLASAGKTPFRELPMAEWAAKAVAASFTSYRCHAGRDDRCAWHFVSEDA